jgi:hypothetical protein
MKSAFGFCFTFIHVIVLTTGVNEVAEHFKWAAPVTVAAWLLAGIAGLVPIVRTLVLFAIVASLMVWWKAMLVAPLAASVLFLIEAAGIQILKQRN